MHAAPSSDSPASKAGFVAIIGEPNVGKSTLMNAALGSKLSIVTPKPQTTRKRVLGIYTKDAVQMVFLDTPGILTPRYELQRSMMEYVRDAIDSADLLLLLLDVTRRDISLDFLQEKLRLGLQQSKKPLIIALNKMDALHNKKEALPMIASLDALDFVNEVVPISALHQHNTDDLLATLAGHLPQHEFFYDPEFISEMPERFFVSELIREVIFGRYKQEIPYSSEVTIREFKEREHRKWYIAADVVVERDTQKAIIIGKGGASLKETGSRARLAIEEHLGQPVYLELFVKVRADWRNNKTHLHSFGY